MIDFGNKMEKNQLISLIILWEFIREKNSA